MPALLTSPLLMIGLGGAIGSILRYVVSISLQSAPYSGHSFPWGTFCVNLLGSFLLGAAAAYFTTTTQTASPSFKLFLTFGILGGFTTFSALSLESLYMIQSGQINMALVYGAGSMTTGIALCGAGFYTFKSIF